MLIEKKKEGPTYGRIINNNHEINFPKLSFTDTELMHPSCVLVQHHTSQEAHKVTPRPEANGSSTNSEGYKRHRCSWVDLLAPLSWFISLH